MLLYNPPFLMVGPVTVFPDHVDPEAFYYLVAVPQIVMENGEPCFWGTAILPPAAVSAGAPAESQQDATRALVSFDLHLPLPNDPEGLLEKEIQKRWGRKPRHLAPAPLHGGTVSLTVARPAGDEASKQFFVYTGHSPALVGDNRAAFAIAAEGREAQALVAAMSVGHLAGVVTYDLEFAGLAPSFEARMVVHWRIVYSKFREREMTNMIFVAEEVDKTIEKLEQSHALEIEVRELDPDGAKAATKSLFDELKSLVMKKLFEAPRPTGEVPVEERIGRGVRDVLTSLMPGVSHTLRQLDESTLSDAVIDLREQQVNFYKFYPQSTLAGLLDRAGHAADRLVFVRVEDLPHRVEHVLVELAGDAGRLGVTGVDIAVKVTTPGRIESLVETSVHLAAAASERKTVSFRRLGTEEPDVQYRVDMFMNPERAPGGRERWSFDWKPATGNRIRFDPQEWLDTAEVRLEVDDPAVLDASRVGVDIQAWLPGGATPLQEANLQFMKESLSQTFSVVVPDEQRPVFRARETFRRTGEPDFVRDIPALTGAVHRIMNPFGQAWSMQVHASFARPQTAVLFAEFRVWDVLRKSWLLSEHQFQRDTPSFTLRFSTSLETPRRAEVRLTRVDMDGKPVRGGWRDLNGPVVGVSDDVVAERRIRAALDVPHFQAARVQKVFMDLEYKDPGNAISATGTLEFNRDQMSADWVHPFPDPTVFRYRKRVRARSAEGERYSSGWEESGSEDARISLPANPWA